MKGRNRLALWLALAAALLALAGCREFPSLGPLEEPPPAAAGLAEVRAGEIWPSLKTEKRQAPGTWRFCICRWNH